MNKNIELGKNVKIGNNVIFGDNIKIGNNVKIDDFARILSNVEIGDNSYIGAFTTIGDEGIDYQNEKNINKGKTIIGNNALIRSYTAIYHSVKIGDNFQTGHRVTIREKSEIGNNVRIGTLSDIQGYCQIGNYVNFHSNVHIGQKSKIEDFVWIFPYCILTNDPIPPSNELFGVTIKKYSVIATNSVILPGVTIEEESFVGAKTLVNKNVEKGSLVVGNPMKYLGKTEKLINKKTGKTHYPWQYNFDRGMPWENIGYKKWLEEQKINGGGYNYNNLICLGDKITLRTVEEKDASFILQLRNKEELKKYISDTNISLEQQAEWIRNYKIREENGQEFYFIVEDKNKIPCGTIRIYEIEERS